VGKRLQVYETDGITVSWDPNLCIHSEVCVRGLPEVFDPSRRRWIRPELADAGRVGEVVARCPSGALKVRWPDGRAPEPPPSDGVVIVRVSAVGPLVVSGPVRVETEEGRVLLEGDAVSLCRCGHTANPPFCDGSHTRHDVGKV
jgi:uncharacterized Fe-S cluster protein YjdI